MRLGIDTPRALLVCVLAIVLAPASAVALPSEEPFTIVPGSFHIVPSSGQAGAHGDLTTSFDFAHVESGKEAGRTYNDAKTTIVNLPPGFVGNNTAVPTCTTTELIGTFVGKPECPPASQVGTISLDLTVGQKPVKSLFPIYNMQITTPGVAAQLGFDAIEFVQVISIGVRPGDLGLTATSRDIQETAEPHDVSVTIWGVPSAHEHDAERGRRCFQKAGNEVEAACEGGGEEVTGTPKPYLANPTRCTEAPLAATMLSNSWEQPEAWSEAPTEIVAMTGCERVRFDPSIEVEPSTRSAESPTGLDFSIQVPQTWENQNSLSTSDLKDATVTLPEGVTINPSAGSGLGACTPQQYEAETASSPLGVGCPPESKIGSIEIETPVLAEKVPGAVYIATPYDNPFGEPGHPNGSLLALYVVAKNPARGIVVKVAGKIEPNPLTGRLVTTFLDNPQQPFNRFTLKFRPGATAPLVSPPACGIYTTRAALTPWSAPLEPRLLSSSFETTQGVHEGPCPAGGVPPFHPQVIAGTQNNAAGSYSPFYLRIVREDGEQEITRFSTTLPPGLTGNLSGIPFCPEAAIEAAREATGTQELEDPSCPAASEVGHSIVGAGVGTVLAQTPGKVYLAGPYHGSPLSLVSVTSAKVGPFDLGTVVIRFGLNINPNTAQVEVSASSDAIPHIIDGIVVHVRDIRVFMSRPQFIINPTSCEHLQIQNTITGTGANPADPADQVPFPTTAPFQAADCASLQFKPSFSVSTTGRTSRTDGASLNVKLSMPGPLGSEANIHQVKVELPVQLPSRLPTLQKACVAAQFRANPAGCPTASVVGHARAITPILPVPLEGPAYFVSNGGEAFPNLIVVLQGYGITIDLVGDTFISKQGITSSTFTTVPDQPVTSFELTLPQGPDSVLAALTNLCAITKTIHVKHKITVRVKGHPKTVTRTLRKTVPGTLTMPTSFTAQNGAVINQNTPIAVTGCAKHKAKKAKASLRGNHHGKKGHP